MPKINQEEYETLKKKQEKGHKYIAREKEGHAIVFTDYHGKSEYRWLVTINEDDLKYESLFNSSKVFQFIQWEDEEPYNIQELIEEYLYDNQPKLFIDGQEQYLDFYNDNDEEWQMAKVRAYAKSLDLINQLDEPEVLSQKWIDDNKEMYLINDTSENAVPVYKLQNLLVPKQEEVDPETVADVIADFYKSLERLKEVLRTEVEELKEC